MSNRMSESQKKPRLPSSIDPGWATLIAAILTVIGGVIFIWLQRGPASPPNTPVPSIAPAITEILTQTSSVVVASTDVPGSAATPLPQLVSALPAAQKAIVQKASETLLQAAQALPLIVSDDFENNDYSWPESNQVYTGGIECNTAIEDSAYHISVHSVDGPAYCYAGLMKVAKDFIISADTQLVDQRIADIYLYYRLSEDGQQYYFIDFNPQTQTFSVGYYDHGQSNPIIGSTYMEEINTTGTNKLTLLAVGNSHAVYLNDKLVALFTDDRLTQGQFRFAMQLQEANQDETLLIDHYDLRGN